MFIDDRIATGRQLLLLIAASASAFNGEHELGSGAAGLFFSRPALLLPKLTPCRSALDTACF
jgi:hypothetical protein